MILYRNTGLLLPGGQTLKQAFVSYHSKVETFIEKKVRKSIEFDFITFYQLKF
jgi:hypothetical protein